MSATQTTEVRTDWSREEVEALFDKPFADLLYLAQTVHRANHDPNEMQLSAILSVKTGACPEDCKYCSQSVHYKTGVDREKILDIEEILTAAKRAKSRGATRFCMGAAWRHVQDKHIPVLNEMVREVKALGMETCLTAGMITKEQAKSLKENGLDYYNHNLDTSAEYYNEVITTRKYQDRLDTAANIQEAGIHLCCGGIAGLGESRNDRASFLWQLATMKIHPQSVPINILQPIKGTPFEDREPLDPIEFVRTIAVARILMPKSRVRLTGGRSQMSDEMQALCFLAGASSIHYGEEKMLTKVFPNPSSDKDLQLLDRLGIKPLVKEVEAPCNRSTEKA